VTIFYTAADEIQRSKLGKWKKIDPSGVNSPGLQGKGTGEQADVFTQKTADAGNKGQKRQGFK